MSVQFKRFNWVRSATGWERFQAWNAKRSAMRADFESARSLAVNGFATAWSDQIAGSADLAGQAALKRVQAAIKTRTDKTA